MSCFISCKRIVLGKTKKKAMITICIDCNAYKIPHFNFISKKYEVTFSLLSPEFVDTFENIELEDRTDTEEFLNKIVDKNEIQKTNKIINKLNRKFFKQQKRNKNKYRIASIDEGDKYIGVELEDIEDDMTYWEMIVKLWNKYNKEKTPKNLQKPYYRNFIEYIDSAHFNNIKESEKYLDGGECYTQMDQERIPHFCYRLKTGEVFSILFEKPEYMKPIPRKLTQVELDNLVTFLNSNCEYKLKKGIEETNWEEGVSLWNDQNYEYNDYSPKWFPKYKKIDENLQIPDYTKLND